LGNDGRIGTAEILLQFLHCFGEALERAAAGQLEGMELGLDVDLVVWEPRREINELARERSQPSIMLKIIDH
jgi:hypothetical protein